MTEHKLDTLVQSVEVVVIGAGQAGLAAGYYLKKANITFSILDAHKQVGDTWRQRWDSLELFTPRPFAALPGLKLSKTNNYYPTKNEIAKYFETYADVHQLPIQTDTRVLSVSGANSNYVVQTAELQIKAKQVIVATGPYSKKYVPDFASKLTGEILQIHSSQYKNTSQIATQSVAIIGGGNSAMQLAEELIAAGKTVTIISSRMPWFLPKSILNVSSYHWFSAFGVLRASSNSPISRYVHKRGDGIIGTNVLKLIRNGSIKHIVATVVDAAKSNLILSDSSRINVESIIWATGFVPDYPWLKVVGAVTQDSHPIQNGGRSQITGMYWVGLPWQTRLNSGIINGVGHDAQQIVNYIRQTL